jgi:hypothetical protein
MGSTLEGWKEYYIEKMNSEVASLKTSPKILHIFSAEMKAENKYHDGDHETAINILQEIIDQHTSTREDKGWYLQEMARYKYPISKTQSNDLQIHAHRHNPYLLKPRHGMEFRQIATVSQRRIANAIRYVQSFESFDELWLAIEEMTSSLRFGTRADTFEKALNELARALGFVGQRPDKEWKAGPDNLWAVRDGEYILLECKSEVGTSRREISKDETGQMNNSAAWFEANYPNAKATLIMIIPTRDLADGAGFIKDVGIMREHNLRKLVHNVKAFFAEFRDLELADISDSKIQSFIDNHHLAVNHLTSEYSEAPRTA